MHHGMSLRIVVNCALALTCSTNACSSDLGSPQVGSPQLKLTADSTTLTVRKGCTGHSASFCYGYNSGATYLHLERDGFAGTVTLSSDGPTASLTPSTLMDTQTVTRLVIYVYDADKIDKTLPFSVRASAPGARDASVALAANIVWDPSFSIASGKQIGSVVNGVGSVVQGQQAAGTVVIVRTKFPDPVTLYTSTYPATGPSFLPSGPELPGIARISPNPTTGNQMDLVFDATALTLGTYRVLVGTSVSDFFPLVYVVRVTATPP